MRRTRAAETRIRLCSFTQITDSSINPTNSTEYFDPADQSAGSGGVSYNISYAASVPASGTLPEAYRTNMLLVTVTATWTSGNASHNRSMQTYVAKNGIQSYVATGGL